MRAIKVIEHYAFLLRTETKGIPFEELTDVSVTRPLGGKLFNYWNVVLEGQQKIIWEGVKNPREIVKILSEEKATSTK